MNMSEPEEKEIYKKLPHLWRPGTSGNPAGRPPGRLSIVGALRKKLGSMPEGEKRTYLELFVDKLIDKALVEGDTAILRDIVDRVDGRPLQTVDVDAKTETTYRIVRGGEAINNKPIIEVEYAETDAS